MQRSYVMIFVTDLNYLMMNNLSHNSNLFTILTIVAVGLGAGLGFLLRQFDLERPTLDLIGLPGTLFLRSIYLLLAPFVLTNIVSGIADANARILKTVRWFLPTYCMTTSLLASLTGVLLHYIGTGLFFSDDVKQSNVTMVTSAHLDASGDPRDLLIDIFRNLVPNNIARMFFQISRTTYNTIGDDNSTKIVRSVEYVDDPNMCGIIYFSIFFGIVLFKTGERTQAVKSFVGSANHALLEMLRITMLSLPIALIFLIGGSIAKAEFNFLVLKRAVTVILIMITGIIFHMVFSLSLIYYIVTRKNPYVYMMKMKDPIITAWTTASSAMTLPTTIRTVERHKVVNSNVAKVMLSIAATVNMDAAAMCLIVTVLFLGATAGVALTFAKVVIVLVNSVILSSAAAAVPGSFYIALVASCNAAGIPSHLAILFLALDFLPERFRTACNVYGDCIGVAIANKLCKTIDFVEINVQEREKLEGAGDSGNELV